MRNGIHEESAAEKVGDVSGVETVGIPSHDFLLAADGGGLWVVLARGFFRPGFDLGPSPLGSLRNLLPSCRRQDSFLGAVRHFSEVPAAILDAAGRTGRSDDMSAVALRVVP